MYANNILSNKEQVIHNNVSSVVEFQRWWVIKCKIFAQESTCSKEFFYNNPTMNYGSSKSAKIVLSKSIFLCQKSMEFKKEKKIKNINLGDHSL